MTQESSVAITYATRLTAVAPAAISVIELTGPDAERWLLECWRPASKLAKQVDAIRYGAWMGRRSKVHSQATSGSNDAYEDVVICWTSIDTVEIHCHGGKQAANRILEDLRRCGAVLRETTEKIASHIADPYIAAALVDLEMASTEVATAILLDQFHGALSQAMAMFHEIDNPTEYPRPNKLSLRASIEELRSRASYGLHLTQPWRLAIVGPPNSGKSHLLNSILGYERAIVDPTAGTTRDVLNEQTSLLGWPFVVFDTAGLRETQDAIEQEGVERAYQAIDTADLILLLVEPTQGWSPRHEHVYRKYSSKCIAVHSKADLGLALPEIPSELVSTRTSAKTRQGLETLYELIVQVLIPKPPQPGQAVPFREEHVAQLDRWRRQIELLR